VVNWKTGFTRVRQRICDTATYSQAKKNKNCWRIFAVLRKFIRSPGKRGDAGNAEYRTARKAESSLSRPETFYIALRLSASFAPCVSFSSKRLFITDGMGDSQTENVDRQRYAPCDRPLEF
jgi:hypothetical protein